MIRFIVRMLAVIGVVILSILMLVEKLVEKVSGMIFAIILIPFVIMTILAVATSDWFALGVFVSVVGVVFVSLIAVVTFGFLLTDGRNCLKKVALGK